MLHINLLPIRQLKKRAKAQRQLLSVLLLFLLFVGVSFLAGVLQVQSIDRLDGQVQGLKAKLQNHQGTLDKIEQLKTDKAEYDRKTEIIDQLKVDSTLAVRILDEVAKSVDNQRMWLESLDQDNSSLVLKGVALDNQTVAQFMDILKSSVFITDVNLSNSSLKVVSGRNLKSFELNCTVSASLETEKQ